MHFSDRGPYGRVVHLQPLRWRSDGWPELGRRGEPVREHPVPAGLNPGRDGLARSDDFTGTRLGPLWHWQGNPDDGWADLRGDGLLPLRTATTRAICATCRGCSARPCRAGPARRPYG